MVKDGVIIVLRIKKVHKVLEIGFLYFFLLF